MGTNNKSYDKQYKSKLYAIKMQRWKQLLGGQCEACKSVDALEFDHVNPKDKVFAIADGWSLAEDVVLEELKKCQLLCKDCHKIKTDTASRKKRKHGTWGAVRNGKCKCDICRKFVNAYQKEYQRKKRKTQGT